MKKSKPVRRKAGRKFASEEWLDRLRSEVVRAIEDGANEVQDSVHVSLWYPGYVEISVRGADDPKRIPLESLIDEAVDIFAYDTSDAKYVATVLMLAESLERCASKLRMAMRPDK